MSAKSVLHSQCSRRELLTVALVISMLLVVAHPSQCKEIILYDQQINAANPQGTLIVSNDGVLYGVASQGGGGGYGAIFTLTPPAKGQTGWTETILYAFPGGTEGGYPYNSLTPDGQGGFFGITDLGGTGPCPIFYGEAGCGTVYHLTPPAQGSTNWIHTVLYSFQGGTDGNAASGQLLLDSATGVLYGDTFIGGAYGAGTVFALTPPAQGQTNWTETLLHTFTGGSDGGYPLCNLIEDASGNLYGTTYAGGYVGSGTAFEMTPPPQGETNWTETVLYSFQGLGYGDAGNPWAGLVPDGSGNLFGAATTGGSSGYENDGAIFELSPPSGGGTAWTEKILYSFTGGKDGAVADNALILDSEGAIYSTTQAGGSWNYGTAFRLAPPGAGQTAWTFNLLYSFRGSPDGWEALGLTAGKVGKKIALFGVTTNGGTDDNDGTVFELTNTGYAF